MLEYVSFLSATGTLRSCGTLSRLLYLGTEHGFGEGIPVSSKEPSFGGVFWHMFDYASILIIFPLRIETQLSLSLFL